MFLVLREMTNEKGNTDDITLCSNGVGGIGDKGQRLGRYQNYVYKPLSPPLFLSESVRECEEFE